MIGLKKKNGGRSTKIKILLPPPEEFQPIDFTVKNTDLTIETVSGDVIISGYWIRDGHAHPPQTVVMSVAGVMVTQHDNRVASDKRSYLKIFQDRIDDALAQSISAEGIIYGTLNEALEFAKRFNSLLTRHMRMTETEFTQVRDLILINFILFTLFIGERIFVWFEWYSHLFKLSQISNVHTLSDHPF